MTNKENMNNGIINGELKQTVEREIAVKCHLYFKMNPEETLEEAENRIHEYLKSIYENNKNPFEYQIHEIEEQEI